MSIRNKIPDEEIEQKQDDDNSETERPSYYYDDSHGYENYNPEKEDEEDFDD